MEITRYKDQYVIRFYYTKKDGTRIHPSITSKDWKVGKYKERDFKKTIALQAVLAKQKELEQQELEENKSTMDSMLEKFFQFDLLTSKESTNLLKQRTMKKYILSYFGENTIPSNVITTKSVTDFRLKLSSIDVGYVTRNHVQTMFKQFLDFLIAQEEIEINVGYRCKSLLVPFKKSETIITEDVVGDNFWSKEELDKFLATFKDDDPYRFFFYTSFVCATRIGETLGLKFKDFEPKNFTLSIKRQLSKDCGITTTKTTSSTDTIRLPQGYFAELEKYRIAIEANNDDFLFFPSKHLSRTTIGRVMESHIEKAGVKKITIHGLRHSMASYLFLKGFNYLYVSKYLRHSSPNTTLRTYAHWIETDENTRIDEI